MNELPSTQSGTHRWPELLSITDHRSLFDDAFIDRYEPGDAAYFRAITRSATIRQMADVLTAVGLSGRGRVLDIGCGAGQGSFAAACLNDEVLAIDINPSLIEICEEARVRHGVHNLSFACRSFASPLLIDGSFDAAICSEVLYIVDTEACMRRLGALVRPGGVVYLRTHCFPWALRYWLRSILKLSPLDFALYSRRLALALPRQLFGFRPSRRYQYLTRRELYRLMAASGFDLVAATGDDGEHDLYALAPTLRSWRGPGPGGILYFIDAVGRRR